MEGESGKLESSPFLQLPLFSKAFDHIQEQLQAQIKLNQAPSIVVRVQRKLLLRLDFEVVAELKTDALKERHWKQIAAWLLQPLPGCFDCADVPAQVQMLKLSVGFNELTPRAKQLQAAPSCPALWSVGESCRAFSRLGHLWDSNLEKHQPAIKEMLARAQGEMGLEQFLAEARSCSAGPQRSS